jgi:hypothetical protein
MEIHLLLFVAAEPFPFVQDSLVDGDLPDVVEETRAVEQIAQGLVVEIMPAEFEVVVGEVIEIVNEDDIGYVIGPFYVGAGETMRQRFQAAGEFIGECGVSATGTIALRVTEA